MFIAIDKNAIFTAKKSIRYSVETNLVIQL